MHPGVAPYWKRAGIRLIALLAVVAAIGLSLTDRTSAAQRVAKSAPAAIAPKPPDGKDRAVARPPSAPPANASSQREEKNGRQQAAQGGRENEHHRPQRTAASAASRRGRLHRRAAARRTAFHLQRNGFSQRRQCIAAGGRGRRAPARAHAARRSELDAHRRTVVSLSPRRRTAGRRRGARA